MTSKKADQETTVTETKPNENPLISNDKLLQLYRTMIEAKMLDERLAKIQRKSKPSQRLYSISGQEACLVSTAIELKPGDFISEPSANPVLDFILGTELDSLLRSSASNASRAREKAPLAQKLPLVDEPKERLRIAMGVALTLKSQKNGNIVVAHVRHNELGGSAWTKVLSLAAKLELPIIFVVLPAPPGKKASLERQACDRAIASHMPGIPVDSADAVAIYRVAQESLGRTRGGDGPVLIECLAYRIQGQTTVQHDPLIHLKKFLLDRKICDKAWFETTSKTFQKRLERSKH